MPGSFIRIAACLALLISTVVACAQKDAKPSVSPDPLTAEQLAVYRAVLANWMTQDVPAMNLSIQTVKPEQFGPVVIADCAKGLELEPAPGTVVHRFRQQDLAQLGTGRTFTLVDPEQGSKEVQKNDPEKTMGDAQSIEDSVRNAFAHGLTTLSEIQFDKKHEHAIVSYGFRCGGLCGNGGTVVMEKKDGVWKIQNSCDDWVSRAMPAPSEFELAAEA